MLGSLCFAFDMTDRTDRLDPRVWKAAMTCALARSGEGMVVCDADLGVLFATQRAVHLLGRLGMEPHCPLPEPVVAVVNEQVRLADASRIDRIPGLRGGSAVELQANVIMGLAPARVVLFLREEVLRDDQLFATLKQRFPISPRGFQLAQLLRKGLTNRQIAERLHLTESTVKVYLHQLYRDCGVSSRTALVALLERSIR